MTKVSEKLFLGSLDDADQLVVRNSQKIKTVVVLCADKPEAMSNAISISISRFRCPTYTSANIRVGDVGHRRWCPRWKSIGLLWSGNERSPSLLAAYLHRTGFFGLR